MSAAPPAGGRREELALRLVGGLLLALGLAYCAASVAHLLGPLGGLDGGYRWLEHRYAARGKAPVAVHLDPTLIEEDLGPVGHAGTYPPWAVVTGAALIPPLASLRAAKAWFALSSLLGLGLTLAYARWLAARVRPGSLGAGLLLTGAAAAVFGNAVSLRMGQYGLLLNGLLIACLVLHERRRDWASGLLLGIVALKPTISAPFALPHLVRRRWRSLAAAAVYVAGTSAAFLARCGLSPGELARMRGAVREGMAWETIYNDTGLIRVLLEAGVPGGAASLGALTLGALAALALSWRFRAASTLALAALLCVCGRLWIYHRRYDDTMLAFLLLALGALALRRRRWPAWLAFALVGASLWAPTKMVWQGAPLISLRLACWGAGLGYLLASLLADEDPDPAGVLSAEPEAPRG